MSNSFKIGDRVIYKYKNGKESGVVCNKPNDSVFTISGSAVWVKWDKDGDILWIDCKDIEHEYQPVVKQENSLDGSIMHINGKIYKLVEIK